MNEKHKQKVPPKSQLPINKNLINKKLIKSELNFPKSVSQNDNNQIQKISEDTVPRAKEILKKSAIHKYQRPIINQEKFCLESKIETWLEKSVDEDPLFVRNENLKKSIPSATVRKIGSENVISKVPVIKKVEVQKSVVESLGSKKVEYFLSTLSTMDQNMNNQKSAVKKVYQKSSKKSASATQSILSAQSLKNNYYQKLQLEQNFDSVFQDNQNLAAAAFFAR